jgi:thiol-disulfide isomerase/thioredoxin
MSFLDKIFRRHMTALNPTSLQREGTAPEIRGIAEWLNSTPLTLASLRGKVVLIDFWTYSCVNCVRTLPAIKAWHARYASAGLVIIGVHTPEFDFEKDVRNVRAAVERFGITYPVALDNDYATWNAFHNEYWPAHYFIDATGEIRAHHFGEGGYENSEAIIRALLAEAGLNAPETEPETQKEIELSHARTPETYFGFNRLEYLGSPESVRNDAVQRYSAVREPAAGVFYFDGSWTVHGEYAEPSESGAAVIYRFTASKVHAVMDGGASGARVRIALDGQPLTEKNRGADVTLDAGAATLTVREGRMYDLVDLRGETGAHLLRVEFLDVGARCYTFTFG